MKSVSIIKRLHKALSYVLRFFPLQNVVVFNSFNGRGLGDDPKYIALELVRRKADVKLVWIVSENGKVQMPEEIIPVKFGSFKSCFYISIAKVWIDNCRGMSSWVAKRPGQYYIQTWHATLGIKKLGTDNTKSSIKRRKYVSRDMQHVDLMYANSDFRVSKYKTTFWYNGPVLKCDVPRVAFMMHRPSGLKQTICKELKIQETLKIAMYAPTFRDDDRDNFEVYQYDFDRIRKSLESKFGEDFVMLIRLHPNLRDNPVVKKFHFTDKIVDATSLPDMEELLCVTDVLLTDFSSSMFDCSIGGKTVFLIAKDYKHYTTVNRELYFDPKTELPFEFCESENELIDAINSFNVDAYKRRCKDFYQKLGLEDSGNGDKVLADIVMSKMKL